MPKNEQLLVFKVGGGECHLESKIKMDGYKREFFISIYRDMQGVGVEILHFYHVCKSKNKQKKIAEKIIRD